MATNRAVFLDRDGVINRVVFRQGKPCSPRCDAEFEVLDGVESFLLKCQEWGFRRIVITNQPDVSRGLMAVEELEAMHDRIRQTLAVDDIVTCPHDNEDRCECRKPKPGMLLAVAQKWNIDLTRSFLVGDQWKDMEAGRAANCKTILLDYPHNQDTEADFRVSTLLSALDVIRGYERKDS